MSINISELIWTVICFFVLLFVLKALLFNPLIKFMDVRMARIDQGLAEGRQAQQARAENDAMLSDALRQHTAEASRILAEAKDADERERAEALVCAHQEAAQAMQAARKSIRTEQAAAEAELDSRMPELVAVLTGSLLGDVPGQDEIIRRCVTAAGES